MAGRMRKKVAVDGHGILSHKKRVIFEKEFSGSEVLRCIAIPSHITKLGVRAFSGCTRLSQVSMEEGLLEIGGHCFSDCSSLEKLVVPDSVEYVYSFAFANCSGLTEPVCNRSGTVLYRYPDNQKGAAYRVKSGVRKIASTAFMSNPELHTVILPDTVTELAFQAFYESGIRSVTIPAGVDRIREGTFVRCRHLETVILLGDTQIDPNAFCGAPETLTILRKGVPVRANEKYWAIGLPLLRGTRCGLPVFTEYTRDRCFRRLTAGCAMGDRTAMWELGEYFSGLYRQKGEAFFHLAESFWRYFAYLRGEPRADDWFARWEQGHPNSRMPALLDERREGKKIDGGWFYCLGFLWFLPGVRYDVHATDAEGLTLVQSYPYDGGFFESGLYQITYLDEYLNALPITTIYRDPNYPDGLHPGDPMLYALREDAEKVLRRKEKTGKDNPWN